MVLRVDSLVGVKLVSSEWERRTKRMEAHALDEGQSAIGEVYEAAPRLRWTAALPTSEGLYFCRIPPHGTARVVEVFRVGIDKWHCEWSDIEARDVATTGWQFSDQPIREPAAS